MDQQREYDSLPQDVESPSSAREDSSEPSQKDAQEVFGKILSTNFSLLCMGFNDSTLGVLIPYIQPSFQIGLLQISYIYLVNFIGLFCASFANIHVSSHLGTGGTLILGVLMQCFGYALMFCAPSFPIFLAAFFFTGTGVAFQDAQANSFTLTVRNAHRWIGILHAVYGVGTIVAPLVANAIASHTPHWQLHYLVALALGSINFSLVVWNFRDGLFKPNALNAKETAGQELRATLTDRTVWLLNGFFFLYTGAEITSGGWLVQFLVSVRHGDPKVVGYIASVFWSGFTIGRFALADVTHRFGERRMVFIYLALLTGLQLMFWLIPNIVANAITVCLIGFFIGPLYPVGLYLLTEVVPRELHLGAIGFTASFGSAGSAAFPFVAGAIASRAGVQALQPIMIGLFVGMAVFWALVPNPKRVMLI